jgi:GDPmannose 4,6-dehydratase
MEVKKEENQKIAFVTGINGQTGSYLAEILLEKNYQVHGMVRVSSYDNLSRIKHIEDRLVLHQGDLGDESVLTELFCKIRPHEVYNLGALSHVHSSFQMPLLTGNITGLGFLRVLEAIRKSGLEKQTRVYSAISSECFGQVQEIPQKETTPFYPRSPYAIAKLYAYWIGKNYRESYGMFVTNGILFNHESPRRTPTFVTRKTTQAIARIVNGSKEPLVLGNLSSQRDWGHARDYARAIHMMLQHEKPDDFVVCSGITRSVRDFVTQSFAIAGMEIKWEGQGMEEVAKDIKTGQTVVKVDQKFFRPAEVDLLLGDCTKIQQTLGWKPLITFDELVREMVEHDLTFVSTSRV